MNEHRAHARRLVRHHRRTPMPAHKETQLQLRARRWLIRNDPDPTRFWRSAALDSDFIAAVCINVMTYGPDVEGQRIMELAGYP